MELNNTYKVIVIGTSAGGLKVLKELFAALTPNFTLSVLVVQHLSPQSDGFMAHYLNKLSHLTIKEADAGELLLPNHAYIAPANYHLLVEKDHSLSLSVSEKVSYARPSIDVLFESAAEVFLDQLIGIVLTGANDDGAKGLINIHQFGGLTIVQDPAEAEVSAMPLAAIQTGKVDHVLGMSEIIKLLNTLSEQNHLGKHRSI